MGLYPPQCHMAVNSRLKEQLCKYDSQEKRRGAAAPVEVAGSSSIWGTADKLIDKILNSNIQQGEWTASKPKVGRVRLRAEKMNGETHSGLVLGQLHSGNELKSRL